MRAHYFLSSLNRHVRAVAASLVVLACSGEGTPADPGDELESKSGAIGGKVSVCHVPASKAAILEVAAAALSSHLAHGDYVTTLIVSHDDAAPRTEGVHFRRVTDALQAARATRLARSELITAACRITVAVAAGRYEGTIATTTGDQEQLPLVVDVPDITLRGALRMEIDGFARALGSGESAVKSVLASLGNLPVVATVQTPMIIANGHPGGGAAHRLIVEGFVFASGPTPLTNVSGQGILGVRVNDITIRGNRFESGFSESIDLRASSGDVVQNHLRGPGGTCDICLAAPGRYRATGNRMVSGGIPGITTSGVVGLPLPAGIEPYVLPVTAEVWTEVRNNEVRDHVRVPVGVGIRVETVGTLAPDVINTVHSTIRDNHIVNNRFGIIVHAGFPVAGSTLRSNADIVLGGNTFTQSCQAKLLISMSRHQRTLGLNAVLPYLQSSSYQITLNGDLDWADVWYDHPGGRSNELQVNGQPVANGVRQFYSAAGCPGL